MTLKISKIGWGTTKIGRNTQVKYPAKFKIINDEDFLKIISFLVDYNINFIDTAPAYGNSEERLGKYLYQIAPRDNWFIASKTGEIFENGKSSFNFNREHTIKSIHNSLKKLNTSYLDFVFIHLSNNDLMDLKNTEILTTLKDLKTEGLIKKIGASVKTIEAAKFTINNMDALMIEYNYGLPKEMQLEIAEILTNANKQNIFTVIKKVLGSGHLALNNLEDCFSFVFKQKFDNLLIGSTNIKHLKKNISIINQLKINNNIS